MISNDIKKQVLSEDFFRKCQNNLNWIDISAYQKLSENFIREFQDKVIWHSISHYQKLSKEFIIEFADKISLNDLTYNIHISDDVKEFCRMFI